MESPQKSLEEQKQAELFDRIGSQYELHYNDKYSQQYRTFFYYEPMTAGIDLANQKVFEAMCGSGQTTEFLLSKGARVTGLDISPQMINSFKQRFPQCEAIAGSILDTNIEDNYFDSIVLVGGLHHMHPYVDKTIDELYRVLKPGGYFCFVEPHAGALPDIARKIWYKLDKKLFEANESSIDFDALAARNAARFEVIKTRYLGNFAYILVLNTLFLRIPLRFKPYYAPFLIRVESFLSRFQNKPLSCFIVGQWRKKA